jgi:hypothetical protein
MNRGLPPAVLSPARADLFRRTVAERTVHATSGGAADVSLTVTIENRSSAQGRRFAFHAARQPGRAEDRTPGREPPARTAFLITDQRPDPSATLDHADAHGSAPFLAGAIAQARPDPVLHNPPYREAAGAYRRSDGLGAPGARPGFRSDRKV